MPTVHQILATFNSNDAICNEALLIRDYFRSRGFSSEIFVDALLPEFEKTFQIQKFKKYRPSRPDILIYHYSVHDRIAARMRHYPVQWILRYHNITPASFFSRWDRHMSDMLIAGREMLTRVKEGFVHHIAASPFNREDLINAGYSKDISVLPLIYPLGTDSPEDDPEWTERLSDGRKNIIFVGRIAPNKKHDDLIRLFYFYIRFIDPKARLVMPGGHNHENYGYSSYLFGLIDSLNLRDSVFLPGKIDDRKLVSVYRTARIFVSMSEHEGFCVPIVEAMRFHIPILAYESSAIPYTLENGGVLVRDKNFPILAGIMRNVMEHEELRKRIISNQKHLMGRYDNRKTLLELDSILEKYY
jgi:glycosyltransferase involved in cell wall biosynthesis